MSEQLHIALIGGRIKGASIGLDSILPSGDDPVELDRHLRNLRRNPTRDFLLAFFPSDHGRMRQIMGRLGILRATLKTDQGMPGNFSVFWIDDEAELPLVHTDVEESEFVAIPEPHAGLSPEAVLHLQESFFQGRLDESEKLLSGLNGHRRAERGRDGFFLVRPTPTKDPVRFGTNTTSRVETAVNELLSQVEIEAQEAEEQMFGAIRPTNLVFCQPDVFVLANGTIAIERINCPDVGLFLRGWEHPSSRVLPHARELMTRMRTEICDSIERAVPSGTIYLLTRDEVLERREDLLELGEITELTSGLKELGRTVEVRSPSTLDNIPEGSQVVLLNLNYEVDGIGNVLSAHATGKINCFPNPFFQRACQRASGLMQAVIPSKPFRRLMQLIRSNPKNETAHRTVIEQIDGILQKVGLDHEILYVDVDSELVPVLRRSLHSWHQLHRIIQARQSESDEPVPVRFRGVPATSKNLLLDSTTGPRMHVFRFLCVS